jgi:hypothetical protein
MIVLKYIGVDLEQSEYHNELDQIYIGMEYDPDG